VTHDFPSGWQQLRLGPIEEVVWSAAEVQFNIKGADQFATDALDPDHFVAEDRCQSGVIDGTHDWQLLELVFDVSPKADVVEISFYLTGQGRAWVDDITLEPVKDDLKQIVCKDSISGRPLLGASRSFVVSSPKFENLDFELKPPFELDWHCRRTCTGPKRPTGLHLGQSKSCPE
jgi:hypothetical protein